MSVRLIRDGESPLFFEPAVLHAREEIEAEEENLRLGVDATPVAFAP
jgi:hypothetical protein